MLKTIGNILLIIHAGLWIWAVMGLLEWLLPKVPWKSLSNPEFPTGLLLFHWLAIFFASAVFLYGYVFHWKHTPLLMIFGYSFMAIVCAVETFGYMTSPYRYVTMGFEYAAYIFILMVLHNPVFQSLYYK